MIFKEGIDLFTSWRKVSTSKKTVKGYDQILRNFCVFVRNPKVEDIKLEDVIEYINLTSDLGWSQNTLIPRCIALRKFFEFCKFQKMDVLDYRLIPMPKKEYSLPKVATIEKYEKLLEAIPENNDPRHIRNKAIINLLWDTGARVGELSMLDIDDIDTEKCRAVIKTEKNKGTKPFRQIFWTNETNKNLIKWIEKRNDLITRKRMFMYEESPLFISICSQKNGKRFLNKGMGEMLRKYSNKAGIPIMNAHSFRHHMGHNIIKQGGSNSDVMNILGHATLESSKVYTMMTGNEIEDRYRKFIGK